jgi:hypothetical protein
VNRYLYKLLTIAIALATAGAQVVCACPNPAFHRAPPPPRACAADKECCRKTELAKPVQPAKDQPCDQCNLKHRAEQAMPDRHTDAAPQMALSVIAVAAAPANSDIFLAQPRPLEIVESPPLLKDLFHVHSLLLN